MEKWNVIHIDVKYRLQNQENNLHHFRICSRLEQFHGIFPDKNTFACDVFISNLTQQTFKRDIYNVLHAMENNGINLNSYLHSLELIISDFCSSQRNGIENGIKLFNYEREWLDVNVDKKFS